MIEAYPRIDDCHCFSSISTLGFSDLDNRMQHLYHLASVVYHAMAIFLVSYAGSHAGSCSELISADVKVIRLTSSCGIRRRRLSCLHDFIGDAVWVLENPVRNEPASDLSLSITIEQFANLWGPLWTAEDREDSTPHLFTERGAISSIKFSGTSEFGVPCHWSSTSNRSSTPSAHRRLPLHMGARMLIGKPPRTTESFNENHYCQGSLGNDSSTFGLRAAGVTAPFYERDGYQANLTGGFYITGSIVRTWRRMPGRTHKSMILAWCGNRTEDPTDLLQMRIGVEISCCTRNARRITFWHLLKIVYTLGSVECDHPPLSIDCISDCWRAGVPSTIRPPRSGNCADPRYYHSVVRVLAARALKNMENTGLTADDHIKTNWSPSKDPCELTLVKDWKNEYSWAPLLRDRLDMASFVTMSSACLEYRDITHEPCKAGWRNSSRKSCGLPFERWCGMPGDSRFRYPRSVFATSIHINPDADKDGRKEYRSSFAEAFVDPFPSFPIGAKFRLEEIGTLELANSSPTPLAILSSGSKAKLKEKLHVLASGSRGHIHKELWRPDVPSEDILHVFIA